MNKFAYTDEFYEKRIDSLRSAQYIVPLIIEMINPESVVDVGCGCGEFLSIFQEKGVKDILGIDGKWINKNKLRISENNFISANLEEPLELNRNFDLVVSLEVAEHLCEKYAKTFINNLARLGPIILFSAAIPFQGGNNHLNMQWPEYWAKLFSENGYVPIDCIRNKIWNNNEVCCWYAQNILLFVKQNYLNSNQRLQKEFKKTEGSPLSLVHPKIYLIKANSDSVVLQYFPYIIRYLILKLRNVFIKIDRIKTRSYF